MKTIFLIFAGAVIAFAQGDRYIATASTTALTLQQPATDARSISFLSSGPASVYCASAQTITLSWNGTAATTTAGTAKLIPPTQKPASVSVFTSSNVGAGTTGPVYNVPAGGTFIIDLSWFAMGSNGTGNNITLTTNGTCTITMQWIEK